MKKYLKTGMVIGAVLIIGIALISSSCATPAPAPAPAPPEVSKPGPTVITAPQVCPAERKKSAVIMGSGFEPGQEVTILLTTKDGITAGLTDYTDPKIVIANENGDWIVSWNYDRYVSKKLLTDGAYVITVADTEYNPIVTTPIAFYNPKNEEPPSWAKQFMPAEEK